MRKILKSDQQLSDYLQSISKDLMKVAYSYISDDFIVDEVISETIYKVYMNRKKVRNPEYLKTWIIRILINECKRELIKKNKVLHLNEELLATKISGEFDFIYEHVYQLNQPQRDIVILKAINSYTFAEVANILQMNENTVKTDYYRALEILRKEMSYIYE